MAKKVIIVGAGYAGIEAAITLNKANKKEDLEIILIDKNNFHTLLTELHEVAGNRVSEEAIRIPLSRIFKYTNVKLICDEITKFDFENNSLISLNKEYKYDYLMMAMGSKPNYYGIAGLEENAFPLWSFNDAIKIREQIKRCFLLASQETNPEERKKLLTFVVGGAGFTGVEMIGELAHWAKDLCKEYNIPRKEVRLIILDLLTRILNVLDEKNSIKAHRYLEEKLGVEILLKTPIKEVNAEGLSTGEQFIATKTLIWAAGVRSCDDVDKTNLETVGGAKRLEIDEFCRTTKFNNVFAVGDISCLIDKNGKPYPAMVENAIQTAHGAALNIVNLVAKKELKKVDVKMHGTMVSVGNYFAVSEIMGKILPVWLSIVMKFMINMHYLWEITGFWGVANYLYHEVLERRQRKLLLEKHWSTRMQTWWVTLLRVFLGVMWLYEGIKKVNENWLSSPKLASFLGMASDSSSSASAVATTFIKKVTEVFSINTGIVNFMISNESKLVDSNIISTDTFAKVEVLHFGNFNFMPWFLNNVILSNDSVAMFFQILVVLLEIGIGLMLIGGAFNFIGSLISFGLMMMFITSTGIYEKTWWMVFASIATMGGAGRAFGLDYYLIPYLNNVWESFWKNRKFRLFFKRSIERPE